MKKISEEVDKDDAKSTSNSTDVLCKVCIILLASALGVEQLLLLL